MVKITHSKSTVVIIIVISFIVTVVTVINQSII